MSDLNEPAHSLARRKFLKTMGQTIILTAEYNALFSNKAWAQLAQQPSSKNPDRLKPQTGFPLKENDAWPESQRIGFALVGLGKLSQEQLLPAFQACKHSKLVALVSGDATKAQTLASQYNIDSKNIYNYQNYDKLVNNPDVQAVYIVLPNHLHAEYTIRSARAGKHVLCEKPMATSVSDSQAMIDACNQAGKKLMIAYRSQYEPHHRYMIKLARTQAFGRVKHIVAENCQNESLGETPWRLDKARSGGGALPDVGIYCLNAARYITGEEPIEISARIFSTPGDIRFKSVEESASFSLRFPSGTTATCITSYGSFNGKRYRVYAENGMFEMDPAFAYEGLLMSSQTGKEPKDITKTQHQFEVTNQFATEIDHLSTCIKQDRQPLTPGEEGLQDVRLIQQIYQSAASGKVIQLSPVHGIDAFRGSQLTEG